MMEDFSRFEKLFPLSKTERFELIPQGETLAHIQADGIVEEDAKKSEDYAEAKKIIDAFHRRFIEECLTSVDIDWQPLAEALDDYHKEKNDKTDKSLKDLMKKKRKELVSIFKADKRFSKLFNEKLFSEILPEEIGDDERKIIANFNKFSTYFTAFHENRKNVYSDDGISTAVSYRVIHQNFPKFLDNNAVFQMIQKNAPEIVKQTEAELSVFLNGATLETVFSLENYNTVLTESGISFYNTVLGGISEEGRVKKRGLNEFSNLYKQQHKDENRSYRMNPLYKQILSDRISVSFIPEAFQDDAAVWRAIDEFWQLLNGEEYHYLLEIKDLFDHFESYHQTNILLSGKELTFLSQCLLGQWDLLKRMMFTWKETEIGTSEKVKNKKLIDKWLDSATFSAAELDACIRLGEQQGLLKESGVSVLSYAKQASVFLEKIQNAYLDYASYAKQKCALQSNGKAVASVKTLLDAIHDLLHFLNVFFVAESEERDLEFYATFDLIYNGVALIIPLYNKVRNYMTKKPYSEEKFKLNFKNPTLADGWDKNKEQANTAILLLREGMYYLGIMNAKNKPSETDLAGDKVTAGGYRKMVYKLLPGPNKMLPKVFFSQKGMETFDPPQYILDGYHQEKHKKGDSFDITFCHELIDYFKKVIPLYPGWDSFDFHFSPTESYEDISGFYREISEQGYKVSFVNLTSEKINQMVKDNQLYLFQIYNKDFAPGATGKPNLHTMYWKALFEEENLQNVVYKLNGEAELFYRKKSINAPIAHKQGMVKVNKRDLEGNSLPDDLYRAIYLLANHRDSEIEDDKIKAIAGKYIDEKKVRISEVTHDIIKDKRYTEDKFFFHVPLTANFKAHGTPNINREVCEYIKNNSEVNIIGIDRGERHLLYLSLINQKGDILLQKTLNTVGSAKTGLTDYHQKLDQMEKTRDEARKNWQEIGKIKDMKAGYLSQIVHEIAKLMVENHAIVMLENLNFGFKRGRFKVEKQVYQKFERMLIEKLNYLVFKDVQQGAPGSIYHALQLTSGFESFQKLGRQSGFLFYVPAAYTSKIDPVTGFVDLFRYRDYTNVEKRREFLSSFDSICYDVKKDAFAFAFDYRNFKGTDSVYRNEWVAYSVGQRTINRKTENNNYVSETIDPTAVLKSALETQGVDYKNGENLLKNLDDKIVKELFYALKNTLQMRNSVSGGDEDYILSPIPDENGVFFDSRNQKEGLPLDGDANGAYHIALKGLYLLNAMNKGKELKIDQKDWFRFAQEKPFRR